MLQFEGVQYHLLLINRFLLDFLGGEFESMFYDEGTYPENFQCDSQSDTRPINRCTLIHSMASKDGHGYIHQTKHTMTMNYSRSVILTYHSK